MQNATSMNITDIYTSKKLESIIPKSLIQNDSSTNLNPLGKWNATVFSVSRKKCLLLTNSITRWSLMLSDIKKSDYANLSETFITTFIDQLRIENISFSESTLRELVGEIAFHRTDNDKAIIGTQNYLLGYVDFWKSKYGPIENWNFRILNTHINSVPYKQLGWLSSNERMRMLMG